MSDTRTILLIGASRGLGLGLARAYLAAGWRVIATQRGGAEGALAALADGAEGRLQIEQVDMADEAALVALRQRLADEVLDLLLVNAGISHDRDRPIGTVATEDFTRLMVTNALAPMRVIEFFTDRVSPEGAIAAMSSILGSVGGNTNGRHETYRASKAALNTLLRSFSVRHPDRSVVALHPGWVRTDMGGADADVGIEESVSGLLATLADCLGKPGCVYRDYRGATLPW